MEKLINDLLQNHTTEAVSAIANLHDKKISADRLRLLEADLLEARDSLTMLARVFISVGLPMEMLKLSIGRVVDAYKFHSFCCEYKHRRSDAEKISHFARAVITEALSQQAIYALLSKETLLDDCKEVDQHQRMWYRAYSLLIPVGMRTVIDANRLGVYVYGFHKSILCGKEA